MLVYTNSGMRRFDQDPVVPKRRPIWEFWALLQGSITLDGAERELPIARAQPTLWAFPPNYNFGLHGTGAVERAAFDFSFVPQELEQQLGAEPYYEVALTQSDCTRIRELAELAQATVVHPTQLAMLRQNSILHELSLIALREIELIPLKSSELARQKTEQALGWYASRLDEGPTLEKAAKFVHVSPAYLRRLFHQTYNESPKAAFTRIRKERVEHLLRDTPLTMEQISAQVGLASASTLTHFVKKHFGTPPKQLRASRRTQPKER